MLNKKQSKRRNSWKYGIVLPALAAFMLAFQVKVVAQEKATEVNNSSQEKTKVTITIDKDASDKELADNNDVFKSDFEADVIFSNVIRNASGEITAIKATVKDKNQSQDHYVSGSTPIKPFTIEMEKDSNSSGNIIGFSNPNAFNVTSEKISVAAVANTPVNTKVTCSTSNSTSCSGYTNGPNTVNLYKGAVFYVNGVEQKEIGDNLSDLQLPKGQTIANMNVISPKEAKSKYGKKAKKGAVEITTKQEPLNFSYSYKNDDDMVFNMPDMNHIMTIAMDGVNVGMDAVANIDWQKDFVFEGISAEERKEIQEEMKRAQAEVRKAMKDLKIDMDKEQFKKSSKEAFEGREFKNQEMKEAMKQMEEAKQQMKEAQKQLEEAQKELQKAQKEMDKKKALSKKS